jgi:hypothetical protein
LQHAATKRRDVNENTLNAAVRHVQLGSIALLLRLQSEVLAQLKQLVWVSSGRRCVAAENTHGVAKLDHAAARRIVQRFGQHVLQKSPSISRQRAHSSARGISMQRIQDPVNILQSGGHNQQK